MKVGVIGASPSSVQGPENVMKCSVPFVKTDVIITMFNVYRCQAIEK
jgi:hypothetical protein